MLEDEEHAFTQQEETLETNDDIFIFLLIDAFMLFFSLLRE
jgi:hypothetical protein